MTKKIVNIEIIDPGSPCDIDTDFSTTNRHKVVEYVSNKYGKDNVSHIGTYTMFGLKNSIKSLGTVNNVPFSITNTITQSIPKDIEGRDLTLADIYDPNHSEYANGAQFRNLADEYSEIIQEAKLLNDRVRGVGIHACGILISNQSLTNIIPIRREDGKVVSQWDYPSCESIGLIKMDFLGLDTIDLLNNTVKSIKERLGITIDLNDIIDNHLDDKETYEMFARGETDAIFQFESAGVVNLLKAVKPTTFDDIAAITALYRPGPMSMQLHLDYAKRKNNPEYRVPVHKAFEGTKVEEILKPTFGALVYQESIMQIARQCAGFSAKDADGLRKAIGKKIMSKLKGIGDDFIKGMINNGYNPEAVKILWDGIVGFGQYAFNKSHSYAYALVAYQAAYLKTHYRKDFAAAALEQASHKKKQTFNNMLGIIKSQNMKISPASVNESDVYIKATKDGSEYDLTYGLAKVNGLNEALSKAIVEERKKNGLYKSLGDFLVRINKRVKLVQGQIEILANIGAFDCFSTKEKVITRKGVAEKSKDLVNALQATQRQQQGLFAFSGANNNAVKSIDFIQFNNKEYSKVESAVYEKKLLGEYLTFHPLSKLPTTMKYDPEKMEQYAIITDVNIKQVRDKQKFRNEGKPLYNVFVTLEFGDGTPMVFAYSVDLLKKYERCRLILEQDKLINNFEKKYVYYENPNTTEEKIHNQTVITEKNKLIKNMEESDYMDLTPKIFPFKSDSNKLLTVKRNKMLTKPEYEMFKTPELYIPVKILFEAPRYKNGPFKIHNISEVYIDDDGEEALVLKYNNELTVEYFKKFFADLKNSTMVSNTKKPGYKRLVIKHTKGVYKAIGFYQDNVAELQSRLDNGVGTNSLIGGE